MKICKVLFGLALISLVTACGGGSDSDGGSEGFDYITSADLNESRTDNLTSTVTEGANTVATAATVQEVRSVAITGTFTETFRSLTDGVSLPVIVKDLFNLSGMFLGHSYTESLADVNYSGLKIDSTITTNSLAGEVSNCDLGRIEKYTDASGIYHEDIYSCKMSASNGDDAEKSGTITKVDSGVVNYNVIENDVATTCKYTEVEGGITIPLNDRKTCVMGNGGSSFGFAQLDLKYDQTKKSVSVFKGGLDDSNINYGGVSFSSTGFTIGDNGDIISGEITIYDGTNDYKITVAGGSVVIEKLNFADKKVIDTQTATKLNIVTGLSNYSADALGVTN